MPHARIRGYDVSARLKLPGVAAVVTGEDFGDHKMGPFIKDEGAIAKGKVRYVGEPVAAVAAEDEATARLATQLIEVDYEELPSVLSPEAALAPAAPVIHEDLASYFKVFAADCGGNLMSRTEISEGDVEDGFRASDLVLEDTFETQAQNHLALEPVGALAEVDAGRSRHAVVGQPVRVQGAGQRLRSRWGCRCRELRCLTPRVGGGFGNKMEAHVQPIVVKLAMLTGRPVKCILSREEDFEMVRARHPAKIRMRTGVKRDGTFVAREVELLMDGGAFADDSPGVLGYALLMARGPYRIPHCRCHGRMVYTNKLRFAAFRGFGNPQTAFAGESQIDDIADRLGIDPIELRLQERLAPGRHLVRRPAGRVRRPDRLPEEGPRDIRLGAPQIDDRACGQAARLRRCLCRAYQRPAGDGRHRPVAGGWHRRPQHRRRRHRPGLRHGADADVRGDPEAAAGQGRPRHRPTPMARPTIGAPRRAASPTRPAARSSAPPAMWSGRSRQHAAEMLECAADDLELRPGRQRRNQRRAAEASCLSSPSPRALIGARAGRSWATKTLVYRGQDDRSEARGCARACPSDRSASSAFCAWWSRSRSTRPRARRACCGPGLRSMSAARSIRQSVEGQIEGGFVQGLGFALIEEMVWDGARLANPSLLDYKVPGFLDTPYEIHTIIVETPEPDGPFGAKGCRRDLDRAGRAGDRQRHQGCGRRPIDQAADDAASGCLTAMMTGERRPCALNDYPPQEPFSRDRRPLPRPRSGRRGVGVGGGEDLRYGERSLPVADGLSAAAPDGSGAAVLSWRRLDQRLQGVDGLHGAGDDGGRDRLRFRRLSPGAEHGLPDRLRGCGGGRRLGAPRNRRAWRRSRTASSSAAIRPAGTMPRCSPSAGDWQTASACRRTVIRGCLPVSGVYDFTEGSGLSSRPRFLGPEGSGSERPASPLHNIQDKPPPFLIAHGEQATSRISCGKPRRWKRALAEASGKRHPDRARGCDHFSASYACGDAQGAWAPAAVKFMQEF